NNLGTSFKKAGQLDKAIASYQRALAIKPDFEDAYYNLGNALVQAGKMNEAIVSYQKALEIEPRDASASFNLGIVWFKLHRLDDAITVTKQALQLANDQTNEALAQIIRKQLQLYQTNPQRDDSSVIKK